MANRLNRTVVVALRNQWPESSPSFASTCYDIPRDGMALSGTACHSWDLEWLPTQHPSVLAKFLRRGLPGLLADAKSEHASLPGEVTSTVQELRWSTPALGGPCSSWCWPSETQESSDPLFGQRVFSLRFGLARLRSQPIAFSGARLFSRHLDVRFVFFLRD